VDGLLDWYLLGVVAGLGVPAGVTLFRWRRLTALAWTAALGVAIVVVALALPAWAIAVFVASGLLAWISFRRLSPAAVPAAYIGAAALAFVPALGYLLPAVSPFAGARLSRRADSRFAGLRVLAKD
jgi:hypothetical protein